MKHFRPKKKFGQHLLISKGVIDRIVDCLDIRKNDTIVEIGVGTGQLTEEILRRNPKIVYGIEIDQTVYPIIEDRFKDFENFVLIKKDFFDVDLRKLTDEKIKLTGNLPYNVASHILVNTAFYIDILQLAVFMIQKEVAQKLVGKPKTKDYTFMTVFLQTFFDIEYVMSVPARFFSPPPKVTSAVVKMTPKDRFPVPFEFMKKYKNFISMLFSNRRKMLRSKIEKDILEKAGINPTSRAEELSVEDFVKLFSEHLLYKHNGENKDS
ncbi:16S rRNA (adenine(1518)-N(6)/adenine(1519)-N(6))-dimethyltransferase RsmA [Persephonella sp.]